MADSYSLFTRSWGFDHIALYSITWQLFFYALALLLVIPWSNRFIVNTAEALTNTLARLKKLKLLLFIVVSLAGVAVFYLLREKYFFLGDFNLRLDQIMQQQFLTTEYLTMKLLYYFATAAAKFGYTSYQAFACYSCLAGGVFLFFCCLNASLLGKDPFQKLLFFMAQISTALMLVFCGYIEIYATVIVFLNMYMYFGLRYLKTNKGFLLVVVCLCFSVASHLLSLAVVPSAAMLWYFNNKSDFKFINRMSNFTMAGIIFLLILTGLLVALKKSGGLVLPLSAPKNVRSYMTMFSFKHWWESLNGQLLACGMSTVVLPFLIAKAIREKFKPGTDAWFLLGISGCILLVVLLVNLHRGSGDWDIMASTAVSLNLAVALLITQLYTANASLAKYLLTAVIGLNAIHAFLWIHVNHTDKSIRKIDLMLSTDPGTYYTRLPGLLQLGLIYEQNNLEHDAERMGYRACNDHRFSDDRSCMFYAKKLLVNGKKQQAYNKIEEILTWAPYHTEAYFFLVEHFEKTKQYTKLFFYINQMFDAFLQQPDAFLHDNTYGKPEIYIQLFTALFREEYPKKNFERLKKIDQAVADLEKLLPKKDAKK